MLVSAAAAAVSTTTAAIAAATISSATAAVSAAACAEFLLRSGFIDGNGLAVQHAAVKLLNGRRCAFFRFHFDKAEAFGLAGKFVFDN
jgi:hypothetical protein